MKTILPAIEWLKLRGCVSNGDATNTYDFVSPEDLIEFAKLHVQAALEFASKSKPTYNKPEFPGERVSVTYNVEKLEKLILNAYSLDNIK